MAPATHHQTTDCVIAVVLFYPPTATARIIELPPSEAEELLANGHGGWPVARLQRDGLRRAPTIGQDLEPYIVRYLRLGTARTIWLPRGAVDAARVNRERGGLVLARLAR